MLKKLEWSFIRAAMCSLLAVLILLLAILNMANFINLANDADTLLEMIVENDNKMPLMDKHSPGFKLHVGHLTPLTLPRETESRARYFVVHGSEDGSVVSVDLAMVNYVDESTARACFLHVIGSGKDNGFYDRYRYLVTKNGSTVTAAFLDCDLEFGSAFRLVAISGILILGVTLLVFLLVLSLSRHILRPYAISSERQKRFITDAGHELKTPLTIITANAEVLEAELPGNEFLQNIKHQTERMTKLTHDLVVLSKMDETVEAAKTEQFSLSDAVWEIASPFRSVAEAGGKSFHFHVEEDIQFRGDAGAMGRLISALLDNAVKYSNDGGTIRLQLTRQKKNIVLEVFNTCDPLATADPERLFERFYRDEAARTRESGGTGIGLSMARAIVEANGGEIHAHTTQDGITFTAIFK